jgi:hypothetical protein
MATQVCDGPCLRPVFLLLALAAMNRQVLGMIAAALLPICAVADELQLLNFDGAQSGVPKGFVTSHVGQGKPGEWRVFESQAPTLDAPENSSNDSLVSRSVLGQISNSPLQTGSSLCLYEGVEFGDFAFSVRVLIGGGSFRQAAGIVFRARNPKNHYVLVINSLDGKVTWMNILDGQPATTWNTSGTLNLPKGEWNTLRVVCRGNKMSCYHQGTLVSSFIDSKHLAGRVGFITYGDTSAHFANAQITYTPIVILAQQLVMDMKADWKRLEDVQIFARAKPDEPLKVVGSLDKTKLGQVATEVTEAVVKTAQYGYTHGDKTVTVILPVRDRNGDPVAAVRTVMRRFRGQTKKTAIVRATPLAKFVEKRILDAADLLR